MINMLNYIKSELYRVFHSKGIYGFIGGCSALVLAMNLLLWWCNTKDSSFPYATTRFSFSMLESGMGVVMFLVATLVSLITADEFKFHTLHNSIAFGLSRTQIFLSKLVINIIAAGLSLIVIEGVLIGSGYLLLDSTNPKPLYGLLTATMACIPSFIAGLIGVVSLYFILGNMNGGIWAYLGTVVGFPTVVSLLGMKFDIFAKLNKWLIYTVTSSQTFDESGNLVYLWSTTDGFRHCILVGVLGCIAFLGMGLFTIRKKEL